MSSTWEGDFGTEYTQRQPVTVDYRAPILRQLIPPDVETILEVGANAGQNIEALQKCGTWDLFATEPNKVARVDLETLLPKGHTKPYLADKMTYPTATFDLVLTCGVLIHVPPAKLLASMREIHRVSRKYILIGEYFDDCERMIRYQGQDNLLWRRDYGGLFLDNFIDLHLIIEPVFCYKRTTRLDNLMFWLMEKGPKAH